MEASRKTLSENFGKLLASKFTGIMIRLVDIFRLAPRRFVRLLRHFKGDAHQKPGRNRQAMSSTPVLWWWGAGVLLLDFLGFSEVYETVADFLKFNSRPLNERELTLARSVFGNAIDYRRVRIDDRSFAGPRQGGFCYVSFHHINSWGRMTDPVLIHELVHIWQYQQVGAAYIPMALKAQRSVEGYNYGGLPALEIAREEGGGLDDFNLEQQADIIEDYFRLRCGLPVQWGSAIPADLPLYHHFLKDVNPLFLRFPH